MCMRIQPAMCFLSSFFIHHWIERGIFVVPTEKSKRKNLPLGAEPTL